MRKFTVPVMVPRTVPCDGGCCSLSGERSSLARPSQSQIPMLPSGSTFSFGRAVRVVVVRCFHAAAPSARIDRLQLDSKLSSKVGRASAPGQDKADCSAALPFGASRVMRFAESRSGKVAFPQMHLSRCTSAPGSVMPFEGDFSHDLSSDETTP